MQVTNLGESDKEASYRREHDQSDQNEAHVLAVEFYIQIKAHIVYHYIDAPAREITWITEMRYKIVYVPRYRIYFTYSIEHDVYCGNEDLPYTIHAE